MSDFSVNIGPRILRQGGSAAQVVSAVVPDPPQAIRAMDNGTILKGVVQGRDHDGLTIIATDKGAIKAAANPPPPVGTQVTLEVRIAGDRLQVLILATDNQPVAAARRAEPGEVANEPGTARNQNSPGAERATPSAGQQLPRANASSAATIPIVTQVGTIVEAIIVRADTEALRQILTQSMALLSESGTASARNTRGSADASDKPFAPGHPPAAPTSPTRATIPGPIGILQPEQSAQIENLFKEFGGSELPMLTRQQPAGMNISDAQTASQRQGTAVPSSAQLLAEAKAHEQNATHGATGVSALKSQTSIIHSGNSAFKAAAGDHSSPWAQLPNGAEIRIRISMLPTPAPSDLAAAISATPGGASISGRVIGHTPAGATIVATPFGAVVLKRDLALPVGTAILLGLEPQAASQVPTAALLNAPMSAQQLLLQISRGWPTLVEVIAILRGRSTSVGSIDPTSRLPQPGPRLAADVLRTMRAIGQGDMAGLLGSAGFAQQRSSAPREEAIGRLAQEIAQLSQFTSNRSDSDWRCCFIPLWDDGALRQINLFYRRGRSRQDRRGDTDGAGTRFVIEVELSRMGAFQFDGLVREKRFDLVVRSRAALSPRMRHDIGELFQQAIDIGHSKGDIAFQTVRNFPVSPLDAIARRDTVISA